jgi:hypothetical protein
MEEAFPKPTEENPKIGGRKIQTTGSEVQGFSFRYARLFNGFKRKSRRTALAPRPAITKVTCRASSLASTPIPDPKT